MAAPTNNETSWRQAAFDCGANHAHVECPVQRSRSRVLPLAEIIKTRENGPLAIRTSQQSVHISKNAVLLASHEIMVARSPQLDLNITRNTADWHATEHNILPRIRYVHWMYLTHSR